MSSFHLVNVWTDADAGPGGFVPMTESLLWQPDGARAGHPVPAFLFVHGWGEYPHRRAVLSLGEELAAAAAQPVRRPVSLDATRSELA